MAIQLQIRRGTTAQNESFVGAAGEISLDTDTMTLRIHDGQRAGGFVIPTIVAEQKPTANNSYTWFKKYSTGWVEQGGYQPAPAETNYNVAITLPIAMADGNYHVQRTLHGGTTTDTSFAWAWIADKLNTATANTATTLYLGIASTAFCQGVFWEVKGYAAA